MYIKQQQEYTHIGMAYYVYNGNKGNIIIKINYPTPF